MIPSDLATIKKLQKQAERNIARGDWEDDFGLPDSMVPKPPPAAKAVTNLLHAFGNVVLPKK